MPWWIRELLGSFRFLSAKGQESLWYSKRVYEVFLPFVLAAAALAISLLWPKMFQADMLVKFSSALFQFMVFVVPFHLAALAAIATFARPGLDEVLKGSDIRLKVWDNKESGYYYKSLTLRQYTCLLFGYLCSIGVGFIVVFVLLSGLDLAWLLGDHIALAKNVAFFLLIFFLLHYGILTIYAITFLFDKVNGIESP